MKTIDIVLPVYNEEAGIAFFNHELFQVLGTLRDRYHFRVIYVVDRCDDNSFGVLCGLAETHPDLMVLRLSRRFGHQMAVVAGMDHSRGDALIMMDCDLQHPPEVIPRLLAEYERGYDIVFTIRHYDRSVSLFKRSTSDLFYKLQNSLSPVPILQGSADFRLISSKVVKVFQESIREQEQFLRGLFRWVGFETTSVEFIGVARTAGVTKYDFWRLLEFSVSGIVSFSKVPLRFATAAGFLISFGSIWYGVYLAFRYLFGGPMPPGYTSIIVALLFLSGLQLLVLGVIGEYVGSIQTEVRHRPLYIIDQMVESKPGELQQGERA